MWLTNSDPIDVVFNDWDSYFGVEKRRKSFSEGSLDQDNILTLVHYSSFNSIIASGNGGVISYSKTAPILIEFSTFTECSSGANGGGIYVGSQCECLVDCVCSYKCKATSDGQLIYIDLKSGNYMNYVYRSSICSASGVSGGTAPICGLNGNRDCISVNISNNNVNRFSGLWFKSGSSNVNNIRYCSINKNHASGDDCLELDTASITYYVEKCNIIENSYAGDGACGIIFTHSATVKMSECCFRGNTGGILFYGSGAEGSITVTNCVIDQTYSEVGNVETNGITNSISLNFDGLIDDCSNINRIKCNTRDCVNKFANALSVFANLFVFRVMITMKL